MRNLMNNLYELTNLALLTPQNLVENIHLENYHEIKYFTQNNQIICEMTIEEEDGEMLTCVYYFDMNNKLDRAYAEYENDIIEIFDRSKELRILFEEYDERKKSKTA